jgi:uncharacterized protein involved in exopolysaccharide biosynthesis
MFQNKQSSHAPLNQEEEIPFLDIVHFLMRSWKIIAIFTIISFGTTVIYLLIAPKQYQAIAKIHMAQISAAVNSNINPMGIINIEDPSLLIARMSSPTYFTPATIAACGLDGKENATSILVKSIKLSQNKGTPNIVELKTTASDPEGAQQCANAIFELIKTYQDEILAPYILDAKIKLAEGQARLEKEKDVIGKADKSGMALSATYLSSRDEIRSLLDEIKLLQNIVSREIYRSTRLIVPIYASNIPTSPQKKVVLTAGLFGGLFLGLIIAFGRQLISKIKMKLTSNP